jgi:histidyl-tRNA synthetase
MACFVVEEMKNRIYNGMRDLLPEDMLRFRYIEDSFRAYCLKYGYREVRTPTLEHLHLFTAVGTLTPSMLSKVYSFLDWDGWGGERVVLRPDGTIPVARLYLNNLIGREAGGEQLNSYRLFYVTNIFSFEGEGKQNRERWQCGAEFLGGAKFAADVEIILLLKDVLRRLGLDDTELRLSHAGLVKALIKGLQLGPSEEAKVTGLIMDGDWGVLTQLESINPELSKVLLRLLSLKGKSSSFLQNLRAMSRQASEEFRSNLEDFINITTLLDNLNCDYEIDFKATLGFEYYTGVCFVVLADGQKIAGGGRYDNLFPLMSGKDIPACGFALYVDPVMKLVSLEEGKGVQAGILIQGENSTPALWQKCFALAQSLRDAGYTAELGFAGQKELDYRWVVLVRGKESSPFLITDCSHKKQQEASSIEGIRNIILGY